MSSSGRPTGGDFISSAHSTPSTRDDFQTGTDRSSLHTFSPSKSVPSWTDASTSLFHISTKPIAQGMPTPRTHYRIALGERNGQHSWIIHSAKGIKWHNIPDELVTLLQKLGVNELHDFSLGSDGRWYVRYRQKGPPKNETSPYLWMDLNQGSSVKLDRLTLGPDAEHWGVHRASDGSFQRFSSVGNRDRFTRLLASKTDNIDSNNQIGFVALGFNGDWAFGVNGQAMYRCGNPFQNEYTRGLKAQKRVSTVILSPLARMWIIVWEDGSLSHNLPYSISSQVEDYCQLPHSLKPNGNQPNSGRPKAPKAKLPQNNQAGSSSAQKQQPTQQKPLGVTYSGPTTTYSAANTARSATTQADLSDSSDEEVPPKPEIYVPPEKLSTTLQLLGPFHWKDKSEYDKVVRLFESGWKHSHKKRPKIIRILAVSLADHLNESYEAYKASLEARHGFEGANEKLVFHGTLRVCSLGEAEGYIGLCESALCRLCSILAKSFLVSKVCSSGRSFKRFGSGIYTSSVSSKADDYTNQLWSSENKVVIVAKVALGKGSVYQSTTQHLTEPPDGYDSILGEAGIDLNYDEQVLFKDEAIRPAFLVIYKQPVVLPSFRAATTTATRPPAAPRTSTNSSTSSGCTIM